MREESDMGKHRGIDGYIKSVEYTAGQIREKYEKDVEMAYWCGYRDAERNCDTCLHRDEPWDDECDGCTKAHSKWEPMEWKLTAEQLGEIEDEFGSAVVRKIRGMNEGK